MRNNANNCDCTKIPFSEECLKHCIELILRKANRQEKQSVLGFDEQLAQAIYTAYNTRNIKSFEDLEQSLNPSHIAIILATFRSLTQSQLDYFNNK